jgi:nicotinate-nucleotide adenylyltransferase
MPEGRDPNGAVGILGGTFDPAHLAHLALARIACEKLRLAQVLWIPAGQPPHRDQPQTAPADRCAMVRAAIAAEARFVLDASEAECAQPSFTVLTLERLRRQYGPSRPLVLLMGADAFRGLPNWYRWRDIFDLAHIGVATRPGYPLADFAEPLASEYAARRVAGADFFNAPNGSIATFELVAGTVSATEVRTLLAAGAPPERLRALLPVPVLDYIRQHNLYGT